MSDLVQTDVPELKYKDALGGGRFFKTHRCETISAEGDDDDDIQEEEQEDKEEEERTEEGNAKRKKKKTKFNVGDVVIKVYVKRGHVPDLQKQEKRVRDIGKTLLKYPNSNDIVHVWPFQKALETERAVYLMRQYSFSTLYNRLNQRPFLSFVEKKWICYQLLHAMKFTHERNVTHGDVKCENVLMTSTNWVFLSDFASFKPKSVPADNPADFTFYFDAGGRRRCYLAPERFLDSNVNTSSNDDSNSNLQEFEMEKEKRMQRSAQRGGKESTSDGEEDDDFGSEYAITREMDVFALGCVIGELFTDGTATFDLAQALAYRNKNEGYEPDHFIANNLLKSVPNDEKARDEILSLILAMIHRMPYERPSVEETFNSCVASGFFPGYFDAVHEVGSDIINANSSSDVTIEYLKREVPDLVKKIRKVEERLPSSKSKGGSPGLRILAQYVCLAIRACAVPSARVDGFYLLEKYIGKYCDDQTRVDLVIPRCIETIKEKDSENDDDSDTVVVISSNKSSGCASSTSRVKAAAIRTLDATLSRAQNLQKSDSKLFQDYIWPALRELAVSSSSAAYGDENQNEYAKVTLAESLSRFCQNAFRFSAQRSALGCKEVLDEDQARLAEVFTKLTTAKSGTIYSDEIGGGDSSMYNASNDVDNNQNSSTYQNNIGNGGDFDDTTNTNTTFDGKKPASDSFDASIRAHRNEARQIILEIFASVNTHPNATMALLENIGEIAKFFGRKETTSFLLPLLVTCLNASDWRTKRAFLSNISDVAMECGASVTESFVVPCAERCLTDINDDVVHTALQCLQNIVSDGEKTDSDDALANAVLLDLQTSVIVNACSKAAPLMCHPIQSIRNAAIDFFASAAKKLGPVDTFALLAPIVEPFQRKTVTTLPSSSSSSSPPLSSTDNDREDSALLWVACSDAFQDPQSLQAALRDPPLIESYDRAVASLLQSKFTSAEDLNNFANTVILESLAIEESVQPLVPYILATLEARRRKNARILASREEVATDSEKPTSTPKQASASAILSTFRKPLVVPSKSIPAVDIAQTSDGFENPVASKPVGPIGTAWRNISSSASWVPRGVLLAHLKEHRSAVNHLATAPTNANVPFFVSCSDDGSCKIWDSRRLERDVSFRSRLTYASQSGKIKSACVLSENRVCSGSDRGSVHVWRVEYVKAMKTSKSAGEDGPGGRKRMYTGAAEKYIGAAEIHAYDLSEGAVVSTLAISPNVVAFATQRGGCKVWDLRQPNRGVGRSAIVSLPWHPKRGVITSLANANGEVLSSDFSSVPFVNSENVNEEGFSTSPWFVLSTSTGEVELIDSRFMTSVARWKAPTPAYAKNASSASTKQQHRLHAFSDSISCMSVRAFLPPSSDAIKMMKPLVWCSHKKNEIALWDASTGECREVLRTLDANLRGGELEAASRARPNVLASGTSLRKLDSDWRFSDPFLRSKTNGTKDDATASMPSDKRNGNDEASDENYEDAYLSDEEFNKDDEDDDANDDREEPSIETDSFRSLLSLPSGALISGGSDCTIRAWFPGDVSKSRILSGPPRHVSGRPRYVETRLESTSRLVRVGEAKQRPKFIRIQQETSLHHSSSTFSSERNRHGGISGDGNDFNDSAAAAARENSIAGRNEGHHDAVTALATVPSYSSSSSSASDAFRGSRMLLSASRDGVIKAWK